MKVNHKVKFNHEKTYQMHELDIEMDELDLSAEEKQESRAKQVQILTKDCMKQGYIFMALSGYKSVEEVERLVARLQNGKT